MVMLNESGVTSSTLDKLHKDIICISIRWEIAAGKDVEDGFGDSITSRSMVSPKVFTAERPLLTYVVALTKKGSICQRDLVRSDNPQQ